MPSTNTITSAVYQLLSSSSELMDLCTIYKGAKRPMNAASPALTIQTKRLEPGEGAGIWMCDIVLTVFVPTLSNHTADQETHDTISTSIEVLLTDAELDLSVGHAHPLIPGTIGEPEWRNHHNHETAQELTFGLIFLDFNTVPE